VGRETDYPDKQMLLRWYIKHTLDTATYRENCGPQVGQDANTSIGWMVSAMNSIFMPSQRLAAVHKLISRPPNTGNPPNTHDKQEAPSVKDSRNEAN
jgi:hypothetical protein